MNDSIYVGSNHIKKITTFFILKPLLAIFIYFALFHRYDIELLGMSGGALAVMIAGTIFAVCLIFMLLENKITNSINFNVVLLFFGCSFIMPFFSVILLNIEPSFGIRFSIEVAIGFLMFYSIYYLISSGKLPPKFIINLIAFTGLIATVVIIVSFFDPSAAIRRLGALGGRNYIANSFAIAAIAWTTILYTQVRQNNILSSVLSGLVLVIILLILFLLGSRQALIAFFLCATLFNFIILSRVYSIINASFFICISTVLIVLVATLIDLTALFSRFELSAISDALNLRFETYRTSVEELSLVEIILGRPDYYEVWAVENAIHPHNYFLSLIRYTGLTTLLMYLFLLTAITISYLNLGTIFSISNNIKLETLTIFLFFLIPFIYSMFSGNVTRIYSLFIFMGALLAILDLKNRDIKNYFYFGKLIYEKD